MRWDLALVRAVLGLPASGFRAALSDPAAAQRAVRGALIADARQTAYGQEHGVVDDATFDALPARTWDELRPWISRHEHGEPGVLTPHRVLFHEPTSGSSGPVKRVPYTSPLRRAFSRMAAVWAHDTLRSGPALRTGRFYASVSPALGEASALVGTTDDADYLDGWLRPLARRYLVDPPGARAAPDADAFWHNLGEGLLAEPRLEVVSVWNPSFWGVLLDRLEAEPDTFARRLAPARADALRRADWAAVWPDLRVLSCWGDGPAAAAAATLGRRMPGVIVQPKGLLSTEAPITVPLWGVRGGVPLVDAVLIELLDEAGGLRPLTDCAHGGVYEVVVSQRAGLVRYRTGDRVQVVGRVAGTPTLRFVGRTGGVSDLVGEKLHPDVVARALTEVLGDVDFATVLPLRGPPPRYALLLRAAPPADAAPRLDALLCRAHHYGHARALGQLGPLEIVVSPTARELWLRQHVRGAGRLGDVKDRPLAVEPADGWLQPLVATVTV